MPRSRDRVIAIVLALAVAALLIAARADGRAARHHWTADPLPPRWHELDRPLTGVPVPVQVYAAATYPIVLHHRPGQCGPPQAVLAEMPPGGVLLQGIEYPPRAPDGHPLRVPHLPARPARFIWLDATWAPFECAGPSYRFEYRQEGRALQAQVWMHPATVAPHYVPAPSGSSTIWSAEREWPPFWRPTLNHVVRGTEQNCVSCRRLCGRSG